MTTPPYPGAPRWVKWLLAALAVVAVLLALVMHLSGRGHGLHSASGTWSDSR